MENKPTYEELAHAIACCVYDEVYFEEDIWDENGDLVKSKNVDNMTSSGFQIPTIALNRLGILIPLDDLARRNEFFCEPPGFWDKIAQKKIDGPSYDMLVMSLICLLDYHPNVEQVYDILTRLGVVEPDTDPPYDKGLNWPEDSTIRWTDKRETYDSLYQRWDDLIHFSKFDDPRLGDLLSSSISPTG